LTDLFSSFLRRCPTVILSTVVPFASWRSSADWKGTKKDRPFAGCVRRGVHVAGRRKWSRPADEFMDTNVFPPPPFFLSLSLLFLFWSSKWRFMCDKRRDSPFSRLNSVSFEERPIAGSRKLALRRSYPRGTIDEETFTLQRLVKWALRTSHWPYIASRRALSTSAEGVPEESDFTFHCVSSRYPRKQRAREREERTRETKMNRH